MSGTVSVPVGETMPISLQMEDGATNLFPRVDLRDDTGASLGSVDLSHVSEGMYSGAPQAMPNTAWVSATYVTYTDAGRTMESPTHLRTQDVFARVSSDSLTAQETRDAMLLAPTGIAAAGSLDAQLAEIYGFARYASAKGPAVYFDSNASNTGTVVGTDGTIDNPVSTEAAMLTLGAAMGVDNYVISGFLVLTQAYDSAWISALSDGDATVLLNGQSLNTARFERLIIVGASGGGLTQFNRCLFSAATNLSGLFYECLLQNPAIGIASVTFVNCHTLVGVDGIPVDLDYSGADPGSNSAITDLHGDVRFLNVADPDINIEATVFGRVTLDASCTAGSFTAAGIAELIDDSGPAFAVNDDALLPAVPVDDFRAAIAFLGASLGTITEHTPTTVTAGGYSWSVTVAGPNVSIERLT